jgi:hypothetical protein
MKILYTFAFVFVASLLAAQISHNPSPLEIKFTKDTSLVKLDIIFKAEFDDAPKVYWNILTDSLTWKKEWKTLMCDNVLCYDTNTLRSSPSIPNTFLQGNNKWEFKFFPKGFEGSSIMQIVLYGDRNFTEELYRAKIYINTDPTSTQQISSPSQIKVFPNPVSEYFSISNYTNVDKVKVYNLFGMEVKSFFHYNNAQHQIEELKSGMYLIRMFDKNGKVVKTVKLNKIHSGA